MASEFWAVVRKWLLLVTGIAVTTITITSGTRPPETCRLESPPATRTEGAAIINKTYPGIASCNSIFTYSYDLNYLRSKLAAETPPKLVVHASVGADTDPDQPLVISVQHQYSTKVMILPYSFDKTEDESWTDINSNRAYYQWSNHTLCFLNHQYSSGTTSDLRTHSSYRVNITVDTPSATGIKFNLSLNEVVDELRFHVGRSYSFTVSPMAPTYFTYNDWNENTPKNDEIELDFSSEGDGARICTLLGADDPSCPVYDSEATIAKLTEKKQVMSSGVLRLRKSDYRDRRGLQILIIPLANDAECLGVGDNNLEKVEDGVVGRNPQRLKNVTITIRKAKAQNGWKLIDFQLYIILTCFVIALILFLVFHCCCLKKSYIPEEPPAPAPAPTPSSSSSSGTALEKVHLLTPRRAPRPPPRAQGTATLMMYSDIVAADKRAARLGQDRDTSLFTNVAFRISLVFMFPVTTLVYLYWQLMYVSGDYDLCYFNEKCWLRVDIFDLDVADFNHVVPNLIYILFALMFTGFVLWRRYNERKYVNVNAGVTPPRGIVFALSAYLALALSLATEGILGGVYHLCPRQTTSFYEFPAKYMIAVVMLSTIHQMRFRSGDHSGVVTLHAVTLFTVALPVFFWLEDISRGLYAWIAFLIHVIFISGYCVHLYYQGAVREGPSPRERTRVDLILAWEWGQGQSQPLYVYEGAWHQDLYMGQHLHTLRHRLNSLWTCFTFCFGSFSIEPGRPNWIHIMRRILWGILILGNIAAFVAIIVLLCHDRYFSHLLLYALFGNVVVVLNYFSAWVILCWWDGGDCAQAANKKLPIADVGAALDIESEATPNCPRMDFLLIACILCCANMALTALFMGGIWWGSDFPYLSKPILICLFVFLIAFVIFWVLICWWHGETCALKNPPCLLVNMIKAEKRSWIRKTRLYISLILFVGNLLGSIILLWPCHYDFAHWLLYVLAGNVVASLVFYSLWKYMYWRHEGTSSVRDSIPFIIQPASFFFISGMLWLSGFWWFSHELIDWSKTPAQSREYNEECHQLFGWEWLDYYDQHSFWHFCSAAAIFFSFMGLLTIDDGVFREEHHNIPIF